MSVIDQNILYKRNCVNQLVSGSYRNNVTYFVSSLILKKPITKHRRIPLTQTKLSVLNCLLHQQMWLQSG